MTNFKKVNNIAGWVVFAIAALTYLLTMEPVSSLWDCSEFIATSYKLEVGHPPGAPLFMMLARLATMLAPSTEYVAMMVNGMNSIASAFCILFLFWTITHLGRRLYHRNNSDPLSGSRGWAVIGAGVVGALAYTFTDTFWFSAVEGEVYALSSMFTALVVWLMLKWEEEADEPHSSRWIILIAYLMGLSIGVHILNLLTIPALVMVYYFRKCENVTIKGIVTYFIIGCAILLFINNIIIKHVVHIGALVDLLFVNTLSLPVNSGIVCFSLALIGGVGWATYYTYKKGHSRLNTALLALLMILVGYSSYASVTIRAVANPPMNSNNPDDPFALLSMLNREQYEQAPLLFGTYYSTPPSDYKFKDVYSYEDGRYEKISVFAGYEFPAEAYRFFPRMWNSTKGDQYKPWAAYRTKQEYAKDGNGNIINDEMGRPVKQTVLDFGKTVYYDNGYDQIPVVEPTFAENLNYFLNYQLNYMYWRYFMWNFVGRQNDTQMGNALMDGNWISGIEAIDKNIVGPSTMLPSEIANNPSRNTYFFLPFILGLIGLVYQLNRDQRNFSVVMLLFLITGIALVIYFNSTPNEPRERDYVYAGSFYAFSIWIGMGVIALREFLSKLWGKNNDHPSIGIVATLIGLVVPVILAAQNWDDHDRSGRTYARDIGWNYLQTTLPNSIILNYGDNDTFPLWNNQEIYDVRPDVKIMNTSYLGGEWYIDQMKVKSNDAAPVPLTLPRHKYAHVNEIIPINAKVDRAVDIKEVMEFVASDDPRTKISWNGSMVDYIPTSRIALPVNKENAIASSIVNESDRDLMVDTIIINLKKGTLDRSELMLLDMLSAFDWKRPIFMTQPFLLQTFGLMDYLQNDGITFRLVPIYTKAQSYDNLGRLDTEYSYNLLKNVYRYGNLSDAGVHADNFIKYNIRSAQYRSTFARVANELSNAGREKEAEELVDMALEVLPTDKIGYDDSNTLPLIHAYYTAGAFDKGDALMSDYFANLVEYLDYYFQFDGLQADMVSSLIDEKLDMLSQLYTLASYAQSLDMIDKFNTYYRSMGIEDDYLVDVDSLRQLGN